MVKFIATDLDGTLLDGQNRLPEEIFPLVEKLYGLGVLFAPASGRQYANLKLLFAPVADKVIFISENGALVKYREETLHLCPIENNLLKDALDAVRALPHLYPMLCGETSAYIENTNEPFYRLALASYSNCKLVDNLDSVIGQEAICKISVFDDLGAANNCIKVLPQRLPKLRTILSGRHWSDVSSPLCDKGIAMRKVREYFHLEKEECIAFGDHMNDYEMLCECGEAYVTENAYPPLKKLITRTVPANTEGGVLRKIKEIIGEIEK